MYKTVETEIDCDIEFSVDDALELLESKYNDRTEDKIKNFCRELFDEDLEVPVDTLEDQLKFDLLKEALKRYSLTQLEEKLK